ncbi:putative oxidoreductase [Azospirillum lipoferum]|nr:MULTISPECIES: DoxX family protein [Azospirillum]MCP1611507.1 putative oxidoreductase [Azospirillum lipoferum]MDW5537308.1 DoxX family protein [Azospirillum sp. NL1]
MSHVAIDRRLRNRRALREVSALMDTAIGRLNAWGAPLLQLALRLWIARVFFNSGLTKIQDWDTTVLLFQEEYKVPLLPPDLAALLGTAFELGMPILLVAGLMTRVAALPLLGMSLVIQFVLGAANPAYNSIEHFYWMFLLLAILVHGPGRLSLDHMIRNRITRS